jgi:hypothetical protein
MSPRYRAVTGRNNRTNRLKSHEDYGMTAYHLLKRLPLLLTTYDGNRDRKRHPDVRVSQHAA